VGWDVCGQPDDDVAVHHANLAGLAEFENVVVASHVIVLNLNSVVGALFKNV